MEKYRNAIDKALEQILAEALGNINGELIPWIALDSKIELLDNIASDILIQSIKEDEELLKRIENAKKSLINKDFRAIKKV